MNLILGNSDDGKLYTYLDDVFGRIPELRRYHWLITDMDFMGCEDSRLQLDTDTLIDGESLNEIIQTERVQFAWGVFSAFWGPPKSIPEEPPYADGNSELWIGRPEPQAEGAEMEIVAWDNTCTLFIGVPFRIAKVLIEMYPDIEDLDELNRMRAQAFSALKKG